MVKGSGKQHANKFPVEFQAWISMRHRCDSEKSISFKHYGAKGIGYCERWGNFENFLADMGRRPKGFTLDRIDSKKDYSKENCRWADRRVQNNNKGNNVFLTFKNKKQTIGQWAREIGMTYQVLRKRIQDYGWSIERALKTPVAKRTKRNDKKAPGRALRK